MKKIVALVVVVLFAAVTVYAQDGTQPYNPFKDRYQVDNLMRGIMVFAIFSLIAGFIITMTRSILGHRLRSKMIDKGVSEALAGQFLNTAQKSSKTVAMKWFTILCGIGAGLTLVSIFTPYGLHSLAIMVFCIAASFLGFYFFLKKSGEQ